MEMVFFCFRVLEEALTHVFHVYLDFFTRVTISLGVSRNLSSWISVFSCADISARQGVRSVWSEVLRV